MAHLRRSPRSPLIGAFAVAWCGFLAVAVVAAAPSPGGPGVTGYATKLTDVAYATTSASQKLDLYLPKASPGRPRSSSRSTAAPSGPVTRATRRPA